MLRDIFNVIRDTLSGKKTYLTSFFMLAFAVSGLVTHNVSTDTGIQIILTALGFTSLRAGISKNGQ
jgi:hypothetical protein